MKKWTWSKEIKHYFILDGDGNKICSTISRSGAVRMVNEQNMLVDKVKELESSLNVSDRA